MRRSGKSWTESGPAVEISPGFSVPLIGVGILLHAFVAGTLLMLVGVGWAALILLPSVATSFVSWLRASGVRGLGRGLARAIWHEDGSWTLSEHDGRSYPARLNSGGICRSRFLALTWRLEDGRTAFALILPGQGERDALRTLRARMRCSHAA